MSRPSASRLFVHLHFSIMLSMTGVAIIVCGCKMQLPSAGKNIKHEKYELVWADEFNVDGPVDSSTWRFEEGFVRNEEEQWYQPENALCKNGFLVIEGRREEKPNPNHSEGSNNWKTNRKKFNYTSASINTFRKHSWKFGRFVMRGKIDISSGIWPAWWTLGTSGKWPANGEIDIMEYYRNKLLANVALLGTSNKTEWHSNTFSTDSLGGSKWASKFHIWRMDWDEQAIALFLDDQLLNRVEISRLVTKDDAGINPFRQPHYMLLNLAIGGKNGGDAGNTAFPILFKVDYVRVYQKSVKHL